ncbi:hypothetical protein E0K89_011380 [Aquicoccus sp. SCR17]|nr:hypothetical protein [Carideicomes alvinocaridis]
MMLTDETGVPQAALPVADFKAHLRLGSGFAEDDLQDTVLEGFLRAAITAIEGRTGKVLITRSFCWEIAEWRDPVEQGLPLAPVTAVTSLTLVGATGAEEVVAPERFRLVKDDQRPRIEATGMALPAIPTEGVARLVLVAGHAACWGELPADLGQAVLLLAAHYYEYRDETALGAGCMPFGVTALIERYRTVRLFAGPGAGRATGRGASR